MAHLFSKDAVKKAAQEGGFAATRRDLTGTSSALTFTPPIFLTFWKMGNSSQRVPDHFS